MTVTDIIGTIVLTGPTGGLGNAVLEPLASRRPPLLVLVGRERTRLDSAAARARTAGASAVAVVEADMSDLRSVVTAGHAIARLVSDGAPPVTSAILNAGLQLAHRRAASAQGIEMTFAVNVVAQHALLRSLDGAAGPSSHAVLVGSGTHFGDWHSYGMVPAPRWQDPVLLARPDTSGQGGTDAGPRAYATSKLAVLHLARAWQARVGTGQRVNVYDPGLMPGTGLARDVSAARLWAWNHLMPAFTFLPGWSTPRRSAAQLVALAAGEECSGLRGGYVEMGKERRSSEQSYDTAAQQRLWDYLERTTAPYLGLDAAGAAT